jgi:pimeloyl-ACP methyl ester carboxylesterase
MARVATMRSRAIGFVAWLITGVLQVMFRCFTMLISHRFPSASLPDVELYTALWLLTQAQYAWRHSRPLGIESSRAHHHHHNNKHLGRTPSGNLPCPATEVAKESILPPRPPVIQITPTVSLFPRIRSGTTSCLHTSPEAHGGAPPHRSVLAVITPGRHAAQRRVLSERALHVIADAAEFDLAVIEVPMLHGMHAVPNLEATLDDTIASLRALVAHYHGNGNGGADIAPSRTSTPTQRIISLVPQVEPPVGVILCGVALGGTIAMQAIARRSPAMPWCRGVLLVDPFVGWAAHLQNRKVSFYDESFGSATSDSEPSVAPTDPNGSASSKLVPQVLLQTPGRASMPGIIAKRNGNGTAAASATNAASAASSTTGGVLGGHSPLSAADATQPQCTILPRGRVERVLGELGDTVQEVACEIRKRCKRVMVTKALRQWFPAAQWTSNGSGVPLCLVLDVESLWYEDQAEFLNRWQRTGDEIEAFPWVGDDYDASTCPTTGIELRQRMSRPRTLASPSWARRHDKPQRFGELMPHLSQWLFQLAVNLNVTPAMSIGLGTPYFTPKAIARPAHGTTYIASNYCHVPHPLSAASPSHPTAAEYPHALPAPMLRVIRRLNSRDSMMPPGYSHDVYGGNSLTSVNGAAIVHAVSGDSISELLR